MMEKGEYSQTREQHSYWHPSDVLCVSGRRELGEMEGDEFQEVGWRELTEGGGSEDSEKHQGV